MDFSLGYIISSLRFVIFWGDCLENSVRLCINHFRKGDRFERSGSSGAGKSSSPNMHYVSPNSRSQNTAGRAAARSPLPWSRRSWAAKLKSIPDLYNGVGGESKSGVNYATATLIPGGGRMEKAMRFLSLRMPGQKKKWWAEKYNGKMALGTN